MVSSFAPLVRYTIAPADVSPIKSIKSRPSDKVVVIPDMPIGMILLREKREAVPVSGSGVLAQAVAVPRDEVPKQAVTFPTAVVLRLFDIPELMDHCTAVKGLP